MTQHRADAAEQVMYQIAELTANALRHFSTPGAHDALTDILSILVVYEARGGLES